MNYNVIDIIEPTITDENMKEMLNIKLYKIIQFIEMRSLNEG